MESIKSNSPKFQEAYWSLNVSRTSSRIYRTAKENAVSDTGSANADLTAGTNVANSGTSATSNVLAYIQLMAIKKD